MYVYFDTLIFSLNIWYCSYKF